MNEENEGQDRAGGIEPEQALNQNMLAEASVCLQEQSTPDPAGAQANKRLVHQLRVHQVELEMQNEELRRTQEERETSRARFVDLYDFAPVGYVTVSEAGFVLEANLTAAALFGVDRGELIGQPLTRFILAEDQDVYYLHNRTLFETAKPQACELWMVAADGEPFWMRLKGAVAREGADGAYVARVVLSDLTQAKHAEVERQNLQNQLVQAQKMESVGRLAGGVAHDFNNMLGVIIGHTDLAIMQMDRNPPMLGHLQEIRKAADRSAALTRQLLAFARKQAVAPRVLDLNDTVEGMLKMLRRLIGEDIDLAWLPGSGLSAVKMDPSQIDQLLANLCVNARDAIADVGTVTIETANVTFDAAYCEGHPGFVPGDFVSLVVSDSGCGMDKELQASIFEPFFTTKGVGQGTGLGLSTVYGVVKQNNGFINVYSEPGLGTTFRIYLPRHRGESEELRAQAPSTAVRRGGETILLVEDEPAILQVTTILLEGMGYTVLAAATWDQSSRLAERHAAEIHLLLTDVVMPQMNGRDLAKRMVASHPKLKVLFMSGYPANVIANQGVLDVGVNFIQKPFSMQDLSEKVRGALDG